MSVGRWIAFGIYLVTILFTFVYGLPYLFCKKWLHYHKEYLGENNNEIWIEIEKKYPRLKNLILAWLRGCGAGFLCFSVAMGLILFIPFRSSEVWDKVWANWALLAIGLAEAIPSLMGALILQFTKKTNTALLFILLILAGFFTGLCFLT
jgi:hypothetical protein